MENDKQFNELTNETIDLMNEIYDLHRQVNNLTREAMELKSENKEQQIQIKQLESKLVFLIFVRIVAPTCSDNLPWTKKMIDRSRMHIFVISRLLCLAVFLCFLRRAKHKMAVRNYLNLTATGLNYVLTGRSGRVWGSNRLMMKMILGRSHNKYLLIVWVNYPSHLTFTFLLFYVLVSYYTMFRKNYEKNIALFEIEKLIPSVEWRCWNDDLALT